MIAVLHFLLYITPIGALGAILCSLIVAEVAEERRRKRTATPRLLRTKQLDLTPPKGVDWLLRELGPPVDWEEYEQRIAKHLETADDPFAPIDDTMKSATMTMCQNYGNSVDTMLEREHLENIKQRFLEAQSASPSIMPSPHRLVCSKCGEPMGQDAHQPGDQHGSTFWYRYPHSQGSIHWCGGMLELRGQEAPAPSLKCPQCGKPMYDATGTICGMCEVMNEDFKENMRRRLPENRRVLEQHGVPPLAINELDPERVARLAEHFLTGQATHTPAWYDDPPPQSLRNIGLTRNEIRKLEAFRRSERLDDLPL